MVTAAASVDRHFLLRKPLCSFVGPSITTTPLYVLQKKFNRFQPLFSGFFPHLAKFYPDFRMFNTRLILADDHRQYQNDEPIHVEPYAEPDQ